MSAGRFTCTTCRVVFRDGDPQREHYKGDWHRYNLKRKVAELPPVTLDVFTEKVRQQLISEGASGTETSITCNVCNKHFSSDNSYTNHINSKKHRDAESQPGKPRKDSTRSQSGSTNKDEVVRQVSDDDDDNDDDWEDIDESGGAIPPTRCLFCEDSEADSVEANMKHMSVAHSFFIPDLEYVTDIDALLTYLGYKVGAGVQCLWCNNERGRGGRRFRALPHLRRHMRDKGHCKMWFDGDGALEYSDFYDYSSTYPDHETADRDAELSPDDVTPLFSGGEEDGGRGPGSYELKLPSGVTVGHRSLLRYYRQNLVPYHNEGAAAAGARGGGGRRAVRDVLAHYKAIGWLGDTQSLCQKRQVIADMRYLHSWKQKQRQQLGVKSNRLQKHFRSQIFWK